MVPVGTGKSPCGKAIYALASGATWATTPVRNVTVTKGVGSQRIQGDKLRHFGADLHRGLPDPRFPISLACQSPAGGVARPAGGSQNTFVWKLCQNRTFNTCASVDEQVTPLRVRVGLYCAA
jgi:hypothetical protein